jgi:outer membrane receptor for ferric coprogen and ferric-rhodotorulic acid
MGSIGRAVVGVGLLLAAILASAGEPAGATPVKLDIKSQPMADALNQWAQATGYQVIFPEESATAKLIAPAIRGLYVPVVALTKLLENSGLRYEYLNARTVSVKVAHPDQVSPTSEQHQESGRPLEEPRAQSESPRAGEPGARSDDSGSQEASGGSSDKLAEIVVTAQKRTDLLLEVPVPVTALTSQSLMENNQSRLQY